MQEKVFLWLYIDKNKKGDRVKGGPQSYADSGVFVTLAPGVKGWVPKGFISKDLSADAAEVLPIGVGRNLLFSALIPSPQNPK